MEAILHIKELMSYLLSFLPEEQVIICKQVNKSFLKACYSILSSNNNEAQIRIDCHACVYGTDDLWKMTRKIIDPALLWHAIKYCGFERMKDVLTLYSSNNIRNIKLALVWAIQTGDLSKVQYMVQLKCYVNKIKCIDVCCRCGTIEILDVILALQSDKGIPVEPNYSEYIFNRASRYGRISLMNSLKEQNKYMITQSAMLNVMFSGNLDAVLWLLQNGCQLNPELSSKYIDRVIGTSEGLKSIPLILFLLERGNVTFLPSHILMAFKNPSLLEWMINKQPSLRPQLIEFIDTIDLKIDSRIRGFHRAWFKLNLEYIMKIAYSK